MTRTPAGRLLRLGLAATIAATAAPHPMRTAGSTDDKRTVYEHQAEDGTLQFSDDPEAFGNTGRGTISTLPAPPSPHQPGWFERTVRRLLAANSGSADLPTREGRGDALTGAAGSADRLGGTMQRPRDHTAAGGGAAPRAALPAVPKGLERNVLVLALVALVASGLLWVLLTMLVLSGIAAMTWKLGALEPRVWVRRAWRTGTTLAPLSVAAVFGFPAWTRFLAIFAALLQTAAPPPG